MNVHTYDSLVRRLHEGCAQAGLLCLVTPTMEGTLCHINVGAGILAEIALHDEQRRPLQSFSIRWSLADKRCRLHHELAALGRVDPFNGGRAVIQGLDVEQVLSCLQQAAQAAQAGKATLGLPGAVPLHLVKACMQDTGHASQSSPAPTARTAHKANMANMASAA